MWRELTETDVLGVLNEPENSAYQSAATGDGQDVMLDVITTVTNQCRGYIGDNAANKLAEGLTLPERCHLSALHLIRIELLTRLDLEVSDARAKAGANALRFFERVSDGKVQIEQPEGATDDSGINQEIEGSAPKERLFTRETQRGL
jgi:hypothetical protein